MQRRQLALLALLAGHNAPLSRDKLIGFLWPETPANRARHQLSDSLYVIRKGLGEEAILAPGDSVQLNPAIVRSDLVDFRSALANESYEEALASYGGPFLDGFFPDRSEPFERWMADERASLKRQAARAAWTLVDRAETAGEIQGAIRWARRGLEIVPEDERGVRRLIRLQDTRGDRAGALRTYEEFAARLEAELDVNPSQETQRLIASIREGKDTDHERAVDGPVTKPDSSVATAESPARPSPQRTILQPEGQKTRRWPRGVGIAAGLAAVAVLVTWLVAPRSEGGAPTTTPATVAVLPFEVRGDGLEVWREGMIDLVSTNIDIFPELRAVPTRTVLARWREGGSGGPAELAAALDIARRTEALYAVSGSVVGTKDGLRIRGEVFDLQTGAKIGETVVEGPPDSILGLVDRLSVGLVDPLIGSGARNRRWPRLASSTTSSPTALKAFLEGEARYRTGDYQQAIEPLKRAIEADSTFALAYFRLAEAYTWTTGGQESREPAQLAARYADRLPDREARLVRAWSLAAQGLPRQWMETLREAVREHPDDPQAWYLLGEAYYHAGAQMLVRPWEFVEALERSVELDPSFVPAYEHLFDAALQRSPDSTRAKTMLERRELLGEDLGFEKGAFRLAFGGARTSQQVRVLLQDFSAYGLRGLATHLLVHPQFLDLREEVLRIALERPTPIWERAIKTWLFWTLVARGQIEAAIELSEDPSLAGDRATMLYEVRVLGYPIGKETLARALRDGSTTADDGMAERPSDWTSSTPAIFERGAYAAERGDWAAHAVSRKQLRALIPTVEPENATDTLRLQGLIEALDGYAAWRRGDHNGALTLLRRAQVWTIGGRPDPMRSVMHERNRSVRAWLGALLLEMDRPREALVYYESLGPGWPIGQDPMIYFHLGRIRSQLGDRAGAAEAYELAAIAWQDPDPALKPLAQTARREAKRLSELSRK